jgi:hypothetical protein
MVPGPGSSLEERMRTHRWFGTLAVMVLAACGSYGAPDEVVFGEAVYTQGAPGFDFKTLNPPATYFLDQSINVKKDNTTEVVPMPAPLANVINSNMAALGYTPAPLATAQVGLHVSVLQGTGEVYYPGYWCDYWAYYGCYYSWYYAGSYKFGTVILEMAQSPGVANPGGPVTVLWTSAVYGVATTSQFDTQRVIDGINRAFAQSPYLNTK